MFEKTLSDKLLTIFEVQKVSFDDPGRTPDQQQPGTNEQETLFIEITQSQNQIRDGVEHAKVTGKCHMIATNSKLPFGYFSKCIARHPTECSDLYFYEFEDNVRMHHDLVTRSFSFVYFFNSQYDPDIGTINEVDIEVETT